MKPFFEKIAGFFRDRKKRIAAFWILVLLLLCTAVFGGMTLYSNHYTSAYRVYLGEEYLCAVMEEDELSSACNSFLSELRCSAVTQQYENEPCRLEEALVAREDLVSEGQAKELLIAHYANEIEYGCGVLIDGRLFAAVSDPSVVADALETLLRDTARVFGGTPGEIQEKVETDPGYYSRALFMEDAKLANALEGEPLAELVKKLEEREKAKLSEVNGEESKETSENSDPDGEEDPEESPSQEENGEEDSFLPLGDEESAALFAAAPVHATVRREEEYTVEVPFEEEYQSLEGYYSDYWYFDQFGESGEALCRDAVTYLCGKEVGRETLSQTVTTEPVPQIIMIGATERPSGFEAGVPSGTFSWPAPSLWTITSYWGDGRGHKGMDIAGLGAYGEPICASDAGWVSAVSWGWSGGYGNYVDIDHGNGYVTRYAHCSELCVEYGEPVAKGEVIAYVGSTGDSSGPHLHFEIIRWGEKVDPYSYLFEGLCIDRC